jgi:hypothetical protein
VISGEAGVGDRGAGISEATGGGGGVGGLVDAGGLKGIVAGGGTTGNDVVLLGVPGEPEAAVGSGVSLGTGGTSGASGSSSSKTSSNSASSTFFRIR